MKTSRRIHSVVRIAALLMALLISFTTLWAAAEDDAALEAAYQAALALFEAKDYAAAQAAFEALGDYSDSKAKANESKRLHKRATYLHAIDLYEEGQYYEAREIFKMLGKYERSKNYLYNCELKILTIEYAQARELYDAGDYEGALALFEGLGNYRDSEKRAEKAQAKLDEIAQAALELEWYNKAVAFMEAKDYQAARDAFIEAGPCQDATERMYEAIHLLAQQKTAKLADEALANGEYLRAEMLYGLVTDYEDAADKLASVETTRQAQLSEAAAAAEASEPVKAYVLYLSLEDAAKAELLKDSVTEENLYQFAKACQEAGDLPLAAVAYKAAGAYQDSADQAAALETEIQNALDFERALQLQKLGQVEECNAILLELGEYRGAAQTKFAITEPDFTAKQLRDDRTTPMSEVFVAPDGSKHCYRMYKGVPLWVEARAFCETVGGHLATMTSAEENDFVYNFMRENGFLTAYFGLMDEERDRTWVWVSGEPVEYLNWHLGQPSYSGRERYGMYFYKHTDGTWNDAHFYEHVEDPGWSYICEWDLD